MLLISEQNELLREIYRRLLSNAGYNVTVKENPEEAIRSVEKDLPDVDFLILGLKNPTDAEQRLLKKIKEKFKDCKILLIVNEMTKEVENFIADHNIGFYLTHPFPPSELLKRIALL